MTKAEKQHRTRQVRAELAQFNALQSSGARALVRKKGGNRICNDPDYVAFNYLLFAQKQLNSLVADLRSEGYGQ